MTDATYPATFREMYVDARARLAVLCAKAKLASGADARYIDDLAGDWDNTLACRQEGDLASAALPEPTSEAYRFLSASIDDPRLDPGSPGADEDALLSWVDAFPDAVDHLGREWEYLVGGPGLAREETPGR